MKYVLIIVLVLLCGYLGYGFGKYYVLRHLFFKDLGFLLEKLNLQINFSKSKILEILSDFKPNSNSLKLLVKNFSDCLNKGEIESELLFDQIKILKEDEKVTIFSFFKSVGRFSSELQTKQIENYFLQVKKFEEEAKQDEDKYSPLFFKFGIIVGVLVGLILI